MTIYHTYFKPVVMEEHMLYAKEIAENNNIYTVNGKLATTFVSQLLQSIAKQLSNYEQLYYATRQGPAKVYPASLYNPVMANIKRDVPINTPCEFSVEGKKYKIMRLEE